MREKLDLKSIYNDSNSDNLLSELMSRKSESEQAEAVAEEAEQKYRDLSDVMRIAQQLPMSWADNDPGKYFANYRFIDDEDRTVVVRGLLSKDVKIFEDKREWDKHRRGLSYGTKLDAVPPYIKVVDHIEQVQHEACPECGNSTPLILKYHQTYDSPDYDEWRKDYLVLHCDKVQILRTEVQPNRF